MRRREFVAGLASATAWPLAARAQQRTNVPVIGYLHPGSLEEWRENLAAFHRGLAGTGYVEGRNVVVEYRWATHNDQLPAMAADLVRRQVAVMATPDSMPAAVAAKAATRTIPITFMVGGDPVALGLVASLSRPGGNATGVNLLSVEMNAKRFQLIHEMVPKATTIASISNPTNPGAELGLRERQNAARVLGFRLLELHATDSSEVEAAFAHLVEERADGLVLSADPSLLAQRTQIVALAAQHAVPSIYPWRHYATAGGLMSYGTDLLAAARQVGVYTGRILNGENPADLPVEQVTKIELVVNLKTAKALGLPFPTELLVRADEVIE